MGARVVVNTVPLCDIANAIYISATSGDSFVGEVYKDTVTKTMTLVNPLRDTLGLPCVITASFETS